MNPKALLLPCLPSLSTRQRAVYSVRFPAAPEVAEQQLGRWRTAYALGFRAAIAVRGTGSQSRLRASCVACD